MGHPQWRTTRSAFSKSKVLSPEGKVLRPPDQQPFVMSKGVARLWDWAGGGYSSGVTLPLIAATPVVGGGGEGGVNYMFRVHSSH